jgi:uncharacterized membrane protein YfcA
MDELTTTYNWIFAGFFIQTIIGFACLIALPSSVRNALLESGLYLFYDLRPIYVYREWQYIDKSLIKKMAFLSFFGVLGYFVLMYGKPLILKKALGVFIILFVLNSLRVKKEIIAI